MCSGKKYAESKIACKSVEFRSGVHRNHSRSRCQRTQAGDVVFDRQGFIGDVAPGAQGLLAGAATFSAAAYRHPMEVSGDDCVSRSYGCRVQAWSCVFTRTKRRKLKASTRSPNGSEVYTDRMKTEALKQALDAAGYDVIFGGARRDEEKSRAKERVFSFRAGGHR